MNRILKISARLSVIIFILFAGYNKSDAQWSLQHPAPQGNNLYGVSFINSSTGILVGNKGTIIQTTDGGNSFNFQTSGITTSMQGVAFVNNNKAVAVGAGGVILYTTNCGANWMSTSSGVTTTLYNVYFRDSLNGTIVGASGVIKKTTDGGITWTTQASGVTTNLNCVYFNNANMGFVAGASGVIRKTTNGGINWTAQTSGITTLIYGMHFIDTSNGWAVGASGVIIHTTNGGTSWATQTSGVTTTIENVRFLDANTGVTAGVTNTILRTTNGGVNWVNISPLQIALYNLNFVNANTGYAVGISGLMIKTTNGGQNWSQLSNVLTTGTLNYVNFSDSLNGIIVGASGTILHTKNGGALWTKDTSGVTVELKGAFLRDANNGTIVGVNGTILNTTNGGTNWVAQTGVTTNQLNGVYFSDLNTGTAVGENGTILRTTDGGNTWVAQVSGTTSNLNTVAFLNANTGVAGGYSKTVLKTTNGGQNWVQNSGPIGIAYSISAVSFGTFFVFGSDTSIFNMQQTVFKSTDGGETWTELSLGFSMLNLYLYGGKFLDANYGYLVGGNGTQSSLILSTTDGGNTWTQEAFPLSSVGYNSVCFTGKSGVTAVGYNATVIHRAFSIPLPNVPTLVFPSNGAINLPSSLTFDWNPVQSASSYRIRIASDSLFNTIVKDSTMSVDSISLSGFAPNAKYYWEVAAINTGGSSSYSSAWNFRIIPPVPATPIQIAPVNGAPNLTSVVSFDWSSVQYASSYRILVASDTGFTAIEKDSMVSVDSLILPGFSPNETYYWKVSSTNSAGTSSYSAVWNFHVSQVVPPAPALISPSNGAANLSPTVTFLWNAVSSATSYRIKISSDSLFNTVVRDSTITIDSLTLTGFANGQYYWKVASINSGGTGVYTSVWKFMVNPSGINGITSFIPKEFNLYNNYPNPFNPSTKIKFDVPKSSIVKISIYDITGRELRVLVNSNFTPGVYEVIFDASSLSSGIYFYKMQTSAYNNVKKMVLIK